ncbi:MAG: hypothetical protein ACOC5D_06960 [Thermoplasmatota archaeon]
MVDNRITSKDEIKEIYQKVSSVSKILADNIEWESIDLYPNTERRLKCKGVDIEKFRE